MINLEELVSAGLAKVSCPSHSWQMYSDVPTIYKCRYCGRLGASVKSGSIDPVDELEQKSKTHTWKPATIIKLISRPSTQSGYKCSRCGMLGYICGSVSTSILMFYNYTCNEYIMKDVIE